MGSIGMGSIQLGCGGSGVGDLGSGMGVGGLKQMLQRVPRPSTPPDRVSPFV